MDRSSRAAQTIFFVGVGASILSAMMFACGSSSNGASGADAGFTGDGGGDATGAADAAYASIVAARPYNFKVPTGYDNNTPTPLVIMLHGYSASGQLEEDYFQFGAVADEQTFLYAYPDGTKDPTGNRFWNADDACCDLYSIAVDDVAYVNAIISDVQNQYNVDPKRIFVVGHSNGAFMSHRLACDSSDKIAAIVSLAGAVWEDASKCNPTNHITVLDIHGDADTTVAYDGGTVAAGEPPFPSEMQTMATWATKNGCTGTLTDNGQSLDLDSVLPGAETTEAAYGGCPTGIDVELWTIHGGMHVPALNHPMWAETVYAFFKAHPKP